MNSKLPNTDSEAEIEDSNRGGRLPLNRYALFFLPCLIGVASDLVTKWYMFTYYFDPVRADPESPMRAAQFRHWWIDEVLGIQTSTNPGALFGMGGGLSWLFAAFSLVALVGIIVWLFIFRAAYDRWLTFTLGMISGGILGNLYDRLGFGYVEGYPEAIRDNVRDWILFQYKGISIFDPWPNFNIADCLLVTGAILLFVHAFLFVEPESDSTKDPE